MEENNIEVDSGKFKNNHNRNLILIGAFVIIAIVVTIILVVSLSKSESKPKLTVSDTHMSVTYNEYLGYSATITGVAKNISGQNISYASVEFSVYDASGNNLGTALANINNLGEGDTWRFEATLFSFPSTRPTSFKLVEINGYSI
ncbi:MAG: FxLYD domain-containing protein [Clostridia bacterium]|nr:FxLYD domain-containing protein [Clostridia bacterium]